MIKKLTDSDIKELKYQCRMGYTIPTMIFILGAFISSVIYEINFNIESTGLKQ